MLFTIVGIFLLLLLFYFWCLFCSSSRTSLSYCLFAFCLRRYFVKCYFYSLNLRESVIQEEILSPTTDKTSYLLMKHLDLATRSQLTTILSLSVLIRECISLSASATCHLLPVLVWYRVQTCQILRSCQACQKKSWNALVPIFLATFENGCKYIVH